MVHFKTRGGKFWKLFFWYDYKLKLWPPFMKVYWGFKSWRYKIIFQNGGKLLIKDRLKFWQKPKQTGAWG